MTAPSTRSASGLRSTRAAAETRGRGRPVSRHVWLSGCLPWGCSSFSRSRAHGAPTTGGAARRSSANASAATRRAAARRTGSARNSTMSSAARPARSADFRYSEAMREAGAGGLVWSEETLDAFLADPHTFVPHSRMSFDGMEGAEDRAAALGMAARLLRCAGTDLPPAEPTATPEEYGLDPANPRHPGRLRNTAPISRANAPPATGSTGPTRASPR